MLRHLDRPLGPTPRCSRGGHFALAVVTVATIALMVQTTLGGIRRPPVRDVDVLVALIEAEVPTAAWFRVNEPLDRYIATVTERNAAWDAQPSLHRPITRPSELDERRREQRHRNERLHADERALIAELRQALLEHDDVHVHEAVPGFALWLEALVASRRASAAPAPMVLAMRLTPDERSAARAAIRPHLRDSVRPADIRFESQLVRAPGSRPTDERGRVLSEFHDPIVPDLEAAAEAAAAHAAVTWTMYSAALEALPPERHRAARATMYEALELNSHLLRNGAALRALAPQVPGLDDEQRATLRDAVAAIDRFAESAHTAALQRLRDAGNRDHSSRESAIDFHARLQQAESAFEDAAREIFGARLAPLIGVSLTGPDPVEALSTIFGDERLDAALVIDDPQWQVRQLERRKPTTARWRSLADAAPISQGLRRRTRSIATDAGGADAISAAIERHDRRWDTEIEPLKGDVQDRLAALAAVTPTDDMRRTTASAVATLEALRGAIVAIEDELIAAIRAVGAVASASFDTVAAERWIVDRAVELLAPPRGHDRLLAMPMLPVPQTIEEVISRAEIDPIDVDIALGLAGIHGDRLIAALRTRQSQLERHRIWVARRVTLMQDVLNPVRRAPDADHPTDDAPALTPAQRSAHANADLDALARQIGMTDDRGDAALVAAWKEIIDDWRVAIPRSAARLQEAWLVGLVPELADEPIPVTALLTRWQRNLESEDPAVAAGVAAVLEAHRTDRATRIAEVAAALVDLPQSNARLQFPSGAGRPDPGPRETLGEKFRASDQMLCVRTLRNAIAVVGVDRALEDPALGTIIQRVVLGRTW